jgi:hypothetical protein
VYTAYDVSVPTSIGFAESITNPKPNQHFTKLNDTKFNEGTGRPS